MSLIEVKGLSFAYNEEKSVLKNVSFSVEKGSYTVIIGHNGSGKSTLAKLLIGLLEKKEGEIVIDGLTMKEENLYAIREKMGIVFQNPDNQFIGSTVRDDIAFGLENHLVASEKMEAIIEEFVERVGLSEYLDKEPQNLSGGQKQRVAIAGVLAMAPEIIIFDEATSMLDPRGKKEIKELMVSLHKEQGITVLSISHDIEEVLQADDCLVLNKGEVYLHDKPEKIFKEADKLRSIGLDIPFTSKVKETFMKNKIRLKADDLEGMAEELWQLKSGH